MTNDTPLKTLTDAADAVHKALGLKYRPLVFRDDRLAFQNADHAAKPQRVMLGEGAFWVVCPADANRLEHAGYEFAPRR